MTRTLVFIDSRVADYQTLIAGFGPDTDWVLLDANRDGIDQMRSALVGYSALDSVQIVSHGSAGAVLLGTTVLDANSPGGYEAQLKAIGASLSDTGDLLLYGCNVAQGDAGAQFISALARTTGADVAASTDLTGLGGNWVLEAATGSIEAAVLAPVGYGATLDVITGDAGANLLSGTANDDVISGLDGDDTLTGGDGVDTIYGGAGNDRIFESSVYTQSENVRGGVIDGGGGDDTIQIGDLLGAAITINGGDGYDTLVLEESPGRAMNLSGVFNIEKIVDRTYAIQSLVIVDSVVAAGETLLITGEYSANSGTNGMYVDAHLETDGAIVVDIPMSHEAVYCSDSIIGGAQGDLIKTYAGNDTIQGGGGNDTIDGGADTDTVIYTGKYADYTITQVAEAAGVIGYIQVSGGSEGVDTLYGINKLQFADMLVDVAITPINSQGTTGGDSFLGRDGNDTLEGFGGNDTLVGGLGEDSLDGGINDDQLFGGEGNDVLLGGDGDDTLTGGDGVDTIYGGAGNDRIFESSVYTQSENVRGGVIDGGGGDDTIQIGDLLGAAITINGGDGYDTLVLEESPGRAMNLSGVFNIEKIVDRTYAIQSLVIVDGVVAAGETLLITGEYSANSGTNGMYVDAHLETDGASSSIFPCLTRRFTVATASLGALRAT